jgi:hypothetical protein
MCSENGPIDAIFPRKTVKSTSRKRFTSVHHPHKPRVRCSLMYAKVGMAQSLNHFLMSIIRPTMLKDITCDALVITSRVIKVVNRGTVLHGCIVQVKHSPFLCHLAVA